MAGDYITSVRVGEQLDRQRPARELGMQVVPVGLGKSTARYLQRVAWETVRAYAAREVKEK
ncbi:MAG: hypothetical protein KJN77_04895 [Gammaproteobacteria bacterium]|nr:hypothetical protein [Gammaproteobacteria bacterium]